MFISEHQDALLSVHSQRAEMWRGAHRHTLRNEPPLRSPNPRVQRTGSASNFFRLLLCAAGVVWGLKTHNYATIDKLSDTFPSKVKKTPFEGKQVSLWQVVWFSPNLDPTPQQRKEQTKRLSLNVRWLLGPSSYGEREAAWNHKESSHERHSSPGRRDVDWLLKVWTPNTRQPHFVRRNSRK